jgi:hypothetical protein
MDSSRKITPQCIVSTLAGTGYMGHRDGEGTILPLLSSTRPMESQWMGTGTSSWLTANNERIRKITPHGLVSTIAGTGEEGHRYGEGTVAMFNSPMGVVVAVDGHGNIIVRG